MARGRIASAITFVDDVTSTGTTTQNCPLGTLREEENTLSAGVFSYRYVQFLNGTNVIAAVAGGLCYRGKTGGAPWIVTTDAGSGGSSVPALVCGIYQSVLVTATYGWIMTRGWFATVKKTTGTNQAWVKGSYLIPNPSTTSSQKAMVMAGVLTSTTTKALRTSLQKILSRNIGFAATAVSSTTATGKAYIDIE